MPSLESDDPFKIIEQRWPVIFQALNQTDFQSLAVEIEQNTLIVNGLQLTSNYDRVAEAELQSSQISHYHDVAYVYGSALGDTISVLLARKTIKKLFVVILNKALFIHSLNAIDQSEWLRDERVQLHLADEFNDIATPFCASPIDLTLAEKSAKALADKVQLELNHAYIEHKHQAQKSSMPIQYNLPFVCKDEDISQLKLTAKQVFIAASGPTLTLHLDYLKKHQPFIIALDASVRILLANGITPNIVVSIDYTASQFFNDIAPQKLANIPLVYFPNVDTKVLTYWPGQRFCSYSHTKMYQDIADKYPKKALFGAGSVIHPAIDLAAYIGAQEIILMGADFAFVNNKSHASDGITEASHELDLSVAQDSVINSRGEQVPTMTSLKGYLRDLERYIVNNPQISFYNTSLDGAYIEGTKQWQC